MSSILQAYTLPVPKSQMMLWALLHQRIKNFLNVAIIKKKKKEIETNYPHASKMVDIGQPLWKESFLARLNRWMLSKPDTRDFKSRKSKHNYVSLTVEKHCSEDYFCHRSLKSSVFLNKWNLNWQIIFIVERMGFPDTCIVSPEELT